MFKKRFRVQIFGFCRLDIFGPAHVDWVCAPHKARAESFAKGHQFHACCTSTIAHRQFTCFARNVVAKLKNRKLRRLHTQSTLLSRKDLRAWRCCVCRLRALTSAWFGYLVAMFFKVVNVFYLLWAIEWANEKLCSVRCVHRLYHLCLRHPQNRRDEGTRALDVFMYITCRR